MSEIARLGGLSFCPGEAWTLTHSFDPAISSSASVKLRVSALEITGVVAPDGSSVSFSLTAAQTGTLRQLWLYDAQLQIDNLATPIELQTGETFLGFSSGPDPTGAVISISAGSGISVSPDPITSTGTITATGTVAATLGGLTNVASGVDSAAAGQVLEYQSSNWTAQPKTYVPAESEGGVAIGKRKVGSTTKTLYRRVWAQEHDTGSGPSGNVTLWASSGTDVFWYGYGIVINSSGNAVQDGFYGRLERWSNGTVVLTRNSGYNDSDSGYYFVFEYTLAADSGD
tara:strand:- start:5301 stop:6155 length:855 start_codon:yes stop_codon:yes gene_type:complete